jgi:hypothetical protein
LTSGTAFAAAIAIGRAGKTDKKIAVGLGLGATGVLYNFLGLPGASLGDGLVGAGGATLGAAVARKIFPEPKSPAMPASPKSRQPTANSRRK